MNTNELILAGIFLVLCTSYSVYMFEYFIGLLCKKVTTLNPYLDFALFVTCIFIWLTTVLLIKNNLNIYYVPVITAIITHFITPYIFKKLNEDNEKIRQELSKEVN